MGKKKSNTEGLKKRNDELKEQKRKDLIEALDELRTTQKNFSINDVCRAAGVSKSYIYKYPDLYELVRKYVSTLTKNPKRNKNAQETLMNALQHQNRKQDAIKYLPKECPSCYRKLTAEIALLLSGISKKAFLRAAVRLCGERPRKGKQFYSFL